MLFFILSWGDFFFTFFCTMLRCKVADPKEEELNRKPFFAPGSGNTLWPISIKFYIFQSFFRCCSRILFYSFLCLFFASNCAFLRFLLPSLSAKKKHSAADPPINNDKKIPLGIQKSPPSVWTQEGYYGYCYCCCCCCCCC